jgi:hypothetical protein
MDCGLVGGTRGSVTRAADGLGDVCEAARAVAGWRAETAGALPELPAGRVATLITGELRREECCEDPDDVDEETPTGDPGEDPFVRASTRPVMPVSTTMASAKVSR